MRQREIFRALDSILADGDETNLVAVLGDWSLIRGDAPGEWREMCRNLESAFRDAGDAA